MTSKRKSGETAQPTATRYQQGDLLEDGPIFILHAGQDRETGRPVALYRPRPEYARDTLFVDRLRAEVLKAEGLRHPGIISVYDLLPEDGVTLASHAFGVVSQSATNTSLKKPKAAPFFCCWVKSPATVPTRTGCEQEMVPCRRTLPSERSTVAFASTLTVTPIGSGAGGAVTSSSPRSAALDTPQRCSKVACKLCR